jgi:hypothetical protein
MNHWVFTVGTREKAPPIDWLQVWPQCTGESWFAKTKRPVAISAGDRAVIYGSQGRGFIAVVEIVSEEPELNKTENEEDRRRFPWKLRHRLLVCKSADPNNVASPQAAGINPNRVVRGPHTWIEPAEYHAAVRVLLEVAAETAN